MRSTVFAPELALAAVGLVAGALVPLPSGPPRVAAPEAVAPRSPPQEARPAPRPPAPRPTDPAGDEFDDLRTTLEDLEAEARRIGAAPQPWPETVPAHLAPDAVRAALAAQVRDDPEAFADVRAWADCSEYPCVVVHVSRHDHRVERPAPDFPEGYHGRLTTVAGGFVVESWTPLVEDADPRRLGVRLEALVEAATP